MPASRSLILLASSALAAACSGGEATAPGQSRVTLEVHADSVVFAAPGATATVHVVARRSDNGDAEDDVPITWRVASGAGNLGTAHSSTDGDGAASTTVTAATHGTVVVTAGTAALAGPAPRIPVHFVEAPRLHEVRGGTVAAGAEAVLTGTGFSPVPAHNVVTFSGIRATVVAATPSELRVRVPACLPARDVDVRVALGELGSGTGIEVSNTGPAGTVLTLQPGEVARLSAPADLACFRLDAYQGAAYLIVVHNVDTLHGPGTGVQVRALEAGAAAAAGDPVIVPDAALVWEARLRVREQRLGTGSELELLRAPGPPGAPGVGDRRTFNVLNRDNTFDAVTAEVRLVSARAVLWVDVAAASSLTADDLQHFAGLFEDPIHDGVEQAFGPASDVDGDGRIGILFTPAVNRLTPRNSSSFIAGFFYGCDLVSRSRCQGTNSGELLYSMVPDPAATWGDARSRASVRTAVPPVLAHEFQHMINFAQRGFSSDALWLSEGLAHAAEDIVADLLDQRGDAAAAAAFRAGNHNRAARYLRLSRAVRLLDPALPGSLEQRGAAWLLLQYLQGHYGGPVLLRTLTASSHSGVASVVGATGRPWADLWSDFGVAIWADGAPGLDAPVASRFTFAGFPLRASVSDPAYPLGALSLSWRDFSSSFTLAGGGHAHLLVSAAAGDPPLNVVISDTRGGDPGPRVRASVLRVR